MATVILKNSVSVSGDAELSLTLLLFYSVSSQHVPFLVAFFWAWDPIAIKVGTLNKGVWYEITGSSGILSRTCVAIPDHGLE